MSEPTSQTLAPVEGHDGILVVRGSGNCRDWNGIHYKTGLSGRNVGARKLSMNVATVPPGGVAVVARSDASEWQNIVDYDRATGELRPKT